MSELRRRIFGGGTPDSTPSASRDVSPAPKEDGAGGATAYKVVPAGQLQKLSKKCKRSTTTKTRTFWIFGLGLLGGLFVAGFFASNNGGLDQLVATMGMSEMSLDSLLDVLPSGLIKEVQDMQVSEYDALPCISEADR